MKATDASTDLRPAIQKHLHRLAEQELPKRVMELASAHCIQVSWACFEKTDIELGSLV
jgi:hypothetical protein